MLRHGLFIALLAMLGIAGSASADPALVEFQWSDPSGTLLEAHDLGDGARSPGRSEESNGKSDWAHAKNEARKMFVWMSRDGINWHRAEFKMTAWSESGATARLKHSDGDLWNALAGAYDWNVDESGTILSEAYLGLSSSKEVWGGEFSARLVSVRLMSQRSLVAVPEPGTLALFGVGLAGLGLTLRFRRRT